MASSTPSSRASNSSFRRHGPSPARSSIAPEHFFRNSTSARMSHSWPLSARRPPTQPSKGASSKIPQRARAERFCSSVNRGLNLRALINHRQFCPRRPRVRCLLRNPVRVGYDTGRRFVTRARRAALADGVSHAPRNQKWNAPVRAASHTADTACASFACTRSNPPPPHQFADFPRSGKSKHLLAIQNVHALHSARRALPARNHLRLQAPPHDHAQAVLLELRELDFVRHARRSRGPRAAPSRVSPVGAPPSLSN